MSWSIKRVTTATINNDIVYVTSPNPSKVCGCIGMGMCVSVQQVVYRPEHIGAERNLFLGPNGGPSEPVYL